MAARLLNPSWALLAQHALFLKSRSSRCQESEAKGSPGNGPSTVEDMGHSQQLANGDDVEGLYWTGAIMLHVPQVCPQQQPRKA